MTAVGITGHMGLTAATQRLVRDQIDATLRGLVGPLVGFSSLAKGADQVFAEAVLAAGGDLVFVQPCARIQETFAEVDVPHFEELRARAVRTIELPYDEPSEDAFLAAGLAVADAVDLLLAVWDGESAGGKGGTADVVEHRRGSGRPWERVWPPGAARG